MSPSASRWVKFVETELWRGSNCYIKMTPRVRLAYSAVLCSFIPFSTKTALSSYSKLISHRDCSAVGFLNGTLIAGLCLSFQPAYLIGGSLIGTAQGLIHSIALRYFASKSEGVSEDKYVDKDFKLS